MHTNIFKSNNAQVKNMYNTNECTSHLSTFSCPIKIPYRPANENTSSIYSYPNPYLYSYPSPSTMQHKQEQETQLSMIMSKTVAIVAVLVSSWLVLAYSVPTEVGCGETYDPNTEPNYAANVNTIIESMRELTPSAPDKLFAIYLTGPNVYGRSACSVDASVTQCKACLTLAKNDMRNICGTTRGGSGSRPVCNMEYGPY